MDDVAEGGGAPTSTVIADGVSNAIFPDISELDRAGGRVNLRKLHVSVQTADTATYMGSNMIVAEPPEDPNVSVTLFTTDSVFDRRTEASSRVESYLNKGPLWPGILYENHIAGQRSVQVLQETKTELPAIGQTLVLVQYEGLSNQIEQYIRTTAVESVTRTFYDINGNPYDKAVVTLSISDALRDDMIGSPASKQLSLAANAAKMRDTVVADAGTYVGVTPLAQAAALGDFTVNAASVYTQLVPSSQTESPILDVRTNGLSAALVATGGPVTQTISMGFTTSTNLFVGGPIYPGSLSIVRSGVTATDQGGLLISAAAEVGQVDYDNGIVKLSTNVWGTSGGSHVVTFIPAAVPDLISDQRAILVTAESRSLNYAFVMDDVPLPRTLSISYLAQGRWYVLRDDGAGKLSGNSSANGVGTLNYTTGSVSVTLGALPDVGSSVVVQSYSQVTSVTSNNTMLTNNGKVYVPINTDGLLSEEKGSKSIGIGSVSIGWMDGTTKLATDDGFGNLTGDATGTVDYTQGVVRISPNTLPTPGTVFLVDIDGAGGDVSASVPLVNGNIGAANIVPGSVSFVVTIRLTYSAPNGWTLNFQNRTDPVRIGDDGVGGLRYQDSGNGFFVSCGTINYSTGVINVNMTPSVLHDDRLGPLLTFTSPQHLFFVQRNWNALSINIRSAEITTVTADVTYSSTLPGADSVTATVSQYLARTMMVPNYTLKGVGFSLGGTRYQQLTDGTLLKDINPTNGGGTPAGSVSAPLGAVFINSWTTGASSTLTDWRGLIAPPSVGAEAPFTTPSSVFRTASSPLRPASLSVLGVMQDGTAFNVTADGNGKINGTRVKGRVDYQYGLVELYFVNPNGDVGLNIDLSFLNIAGLTTIPTDLVMLNSLRYNAVAFSYLPLDANLLGIDPVRLPSDGRVPIFRAGGFAVAGHTGKIIATVSNAQTINAGRVRLSRVRVVGFDGNVINTGYTADLDAGTVTFNNVAGYSQPVTIEHRIEDMGVVREAQISGEVTFTRALTHDYPLGSFLSSALVAGDLKARVSTLFDQTTWTNVWSDSLIGNTATGTYNDVLAPIAVTNIGAQTERWALIFTNTTTFNIVGEHVGVIGTGNVNEEQAPLNPATNAPYFTIPVLGWGIGWSTGNVLRFNTVGAMAPVWVVRTIQQGPNTGTNHSFTILSRGDVDRP